MNPCEVAAAESRMPCGSLGYWVGVAAKVDPVPHPLCIPALSRVSASPQLPLPGAGVSFATLEFGASRPPLANNAAEVTGSTSQPRPQESFSLGTLLSHREDKPWPTCWMKRVM